METIEGPPGGRATLTAGNAGDTTFQCESQTHPGP